MAPDAQWIGCRNMDSIFAVGTPASYTTCFEFLMAPYPQGGNPAVDGQPALGAHVVNNSWGCPPDEGCDVDALREGAAAVMFSGDKLLGGPQAGLLLGRRDLVETCARHPIYRAVRPGRLVTAALDGVLRLHLARRPRRRRPRAGRGRGDRRRPRRR